MNINPIKSISELKKIYYTNTVKKSSSFKGNGSDKLVSQNSNEKKKDNDLWERLSDLALIAILAMEGYTVFGGSTIDKMDIETLEKDLEQLKEIAKEQKTTIEGDEAFEKKFEQLKEKAKELKKTEKGKEVREKVKKILKENKTLGKELEKPEEALVKELKKSLKKSVEQFKKVNK